LSVAEIQNILKNQKEDADTDWIAEIQELKVPIKFLSVPCTPFTLFLYIFSYRSHTFNQRNMVAELRKNHQLEKELSKLDKRIALLIKHRSNIKEIIAAAQKKAKVMVHHELSPTISSLHFRRRSKVRAQPSLPLHPSNWRAIKTCSICCRQSLTTSANW
jgi:hypothetical protein